MDTGCGYMADINLNAITSQSNKTYDWCSGVVWQNKSWDVSLQFDLGGCKLCVLPLGLILKPFGITFAWMWSMVLVHTFHNHVCFGCLHADWHMNNWLPIMIQIESVFFIRWICLLCHYISQRMISVWNLNFRCPMGVCYGGAHILSLILICPWFFLAHCFKYKLSRLHEHGQWCWLILSTTWPGNDLMVLSYISVLWTCLFQLLAHILKINTWTIEFCAWFKSVMSFHILSLFTLLTYLNTHVFSL
jgi:hypothetical protein